MDTASKSGNTIYPDHFRIRKGNLYNRETTDIGPAIEQTVAFGGNSQNLLLGESADNISVTMPAGENLLVLDLSNPLQFTIGAEKRYRSRKSLSICTSPA